MQNLSFFARHDDYVAHLFEERFREPLIRDHPFYANLIRWVADHRSPIFFDISDPSEHFAFSGAYHFESVRAYDGDITRQSIFLAHDFTHLLFPFPHDMRTVTADEFVELFTYQERIASTETELLAYYRVPGLREKVFPDEKLLFDVMIERGEEQPSAAAFLPHRNALILDDPYGDEQLGDHPEILAWMRSWRTLTPKWCRARWADMQSRDVPTFPWERLSVDTYEAVIAGYDGSSGSQDRYERNVLANLQMAYALMGRHDEAPTRFSEAVDAIAALEGEVLLTSTPSARITAQFA